MRGDGQVSGGRFIVSEGAKSVLVAVGILFLFTVVLGGEPRRRGFDFCGSFSRVLPLEGLPCFLFNLSVVFLVMIGLVLVVGLARRWFS